jgi:hypothetical protein
MDRILGKEEAKGDARWKNKASVIRITMRILLYMTALKESPGETRFLDRELDVGKKSRAE